MLSTMVSTTLQPRYIRYIKLSIIGFSILFVILLLTYNHEATNGRLQQVAPRWLTSYNSYNDTIAINITDYNILKNQLYNLQQQIQQLHDSDKQHKQLLQDAKDLLLSSQQHHNNTDQQLQHNIDDAIQRIHDCGIYDNTVSELLKERSYPYLFNAIFVVSLRDNRWDRFIEQLYDWPQLYDMTYHITATDGSSIDVQQWINEGKLRNDFLSLSREIKPGEYIRQMARGELGCADTHFRAWYVYKH